MTPRRSRGRPKLEDIAQIESRLLAVALAEFLKHGYGGTSISRIVKSAGISKTTFYARFSSKEQLFRAIVQQEIERLSPAASLRSESGPLELVAGLISYANRSLEISLEGELLQFNRLIYSESNRFPELGASAADKTLLGIKRIADFIRRCAQSDSIPCRDPDGVAEAFIFMLRGWYIDVMLTNRTVPAAQRRQWVERAVHALVCARAQW